jgi:hypothetical protein
MVLEIAEFLDGDLGDPRGLPELRSHGSRLRERLRRRAHGGQRPEPALATILPLFRRDR